MYKLSMANSITWPYKKEVYTLEWSKWLSEIVKGFDTNQEVLLFHGTKKEYVHSILQSGLRVENAEIWSYVKGVHFAESSQKADQYTDDKDNRRQYVLMMLVVSVAIGQAIIYKISDTFLAFEHYDTVIAENKFRGIIIANNSQCLVQYIVEYDREMQTEKY